MANDNHFRVKNGIKVGDTEVVSSSATITASIVNVSDTILPDKLSAIDTSISSLSAALGTYSSANSTKTLIENAFSAVQSTELAASSSLAATLSSEQAADDSLTIILGYEQSALEDAGDADTFKLSACASQVAASAAQSAADLARSLAEQFRDSASSAKSAAESAKVAASASKSTAEARKESASSAKSSAESAKTSASAAKSSAESAKTSASAAKSSAESAKTSASASKSSAEADKLSASSAKSGAEASKVSASSSKSSADSAKLAASAAKSAADLAKQLTQGFKLTASIAESATVVARTAASAANSAAQSAKTSASAAKSSAESAKTSASSSKSSAEADKLSASSAKSGAEAAKTSASASKSTAELRKNSASAAKSAAESANTAAGQSKDSASSAKSAAESAKTSASAAKSSAESAKTSASAAKSSAESAKTSASAAKSSAESAKTSASAAKSSAESAKTAAGLSKSAANSASTAAGQSKDSASSAKSAAQSASTAAGQSKDSASSAKSAAQSASTAAGQSKDSASSAKSSAESAKTSASAAKSSAESAKTSASAAKSSAESAKTAASASKSTAEARKESASAAKSAAESAKTAAGLSKSAAQSASTAAGQSKDSASSAKSAAESAKTSASAAKSSAESAKTAASASKSTAEARKESASAAKSSAESAKTSASAAKSSAESAKTSASAAKSSAESAKTAASASKSTAEARKESASAAKSGAEAAKTAADLSKDGASSAKSAAESAKTSASAAKSSAESANTAAGLSKSAAESAKTSASAAKSSAESAKTSASAAKSSAESAKTSASAAKSSAESAKTAASASKSTAEARKESASAAKSAAESAKTAAGLSKSAAESAKTAAGLSKSAAESAKTSASAAKSSAESAKTSASAAKSSAESAKTAASASKSTAEARKESASAAKSSAESAKTSASAAKSSAESAKTAASASKSTAEARKESASAAKSAAESAKTAAGLSKSAAQSASTAAGQSKDSASSAKSAANSASTAAGQSKDSASSAKSAAQSASTAAGQSKDSASSAKSAAESAKVAASSSASTAEVRKESASSANQTAQQRKNSASSANSAAQVAKDSAVAFSACSAQAKLDASAAAAGAEAFELLALNAKSSASGANVAALAARDIAVSAAASASADAVATAIHVVNAEADASSTGALRTQIQDARFLEARVSRGLTGHYTSNSWYLNDVGSGTADQPGASKLVTLESGGTVYIENLTTNTTTTLIDNPTKYTIYSIPTLTGFSGSGFYRVYGTVPIVVRNSIGTLAAPSNFASEYIGMHNNRDFPVKADLFSPFVKTTVKVFAESRCGQSTAATTFDESTTPPVDTFTIDAGSYYSWSSGRVSGMEKTPDDDNDSLGVVFAARDKITGISFGHQNNVKTDLKLVPPLSNGEVLSATTGDNYSYPRIVTGGGLNTGAVLIAISLYGSTLDDVSETLHNIFAQVNGSHIYIDFDESGNTTQSVSQYSAYIQNVAQSSTIMTRVADLHAKLVENYESLKTVSLTSNNTVYDLFTGKPETNNTVFTKTNYATACSENVFFATHGTGDGSGGDSEHGIPTPSLSDFYVFPDKHLSNFKVVSYLRNKVSVLDKNDTVLYNIDHSAATKDNVLQHQEGDGSGNGADLGSGNGPYKFVGSNPFYLLCQSSDDDREITMLGARQAVLNTQESQVAVASRIDQVKSILDDACATLTVQQAAIDGVEANYTVKVNNNGAVSGFGFASTTASSDATSAFIVQADRFAIVDPNIYTDGLSLSPSSDITPFEIVNGVTKIKSANVGILSANSIEAGTITGQKIAANSRIEVYTEGNKTNTYAALDGSDPIYRFFVGNDNPNLAPFSVSSSGKVKTESLVMQGFDGNYFDSTKGLGLAALSQISDFVKSGRIATSSQTVTGDFDINDAFTNVFVDVPVTSDVFQQYRLNAAELTSTITREHVGTDIHPWIINIGDATYSGSTSLTDVHCKAPRQDFSVQPPTVVFDIPKDRPLQVGEFIKITWSNTLASGATLTMDGVADANDPTKTFSTARSIGQGTEYSRDVLVRVTASSTNVGFTIARNIQQGLITWTPSDNTGKTPDVLGLARASVPSTIKMKPLRYYGANGTTTAFMANQTDDNPFDLNGEITFTAIEADDSFTDTVTQYRVLTTEVSASYGFITGGAYIDNRANVETGAVDDTGFFTTYTTSLQSGDNALVAGNYRFGSDLVLEDADGVDLYTLKNSVPRLIETETLGAYSEFYVEPEPQAKFENSTYETIKSSVRPGHHVFGSNAYGLTFQGESFLMIENDSVSYSSSNTGNNAIPKQRQAMFLGNVSDHSSNTDTRDNLLVVATKSATVSAYTSKMMLDVDGNLHTNHLKSLDSTATESRINFKNSMDAFEIRTPGTSTTYEFLLYQGAPGGGAENILFGVKINGDTETTGSFEAYGGLKGKGALKYVDVVVTSNSDAIQTFSYSLPGSGNTALSAEIIDPTDFRTAGSIEFLTDDSFGFDRFNDEDGNQDITVRVIYTKAV